MIVSTEKKFIFAAIPKTGTSSIEKVLGKYSDEKLEDGLVKHVHLRKVKDLLDKPYYKFCFFRNPWDRMVSLYHYHLRQGNFFLNQTYDEFTFDDWIKKTKVTGTNPDRQTDYIMLRGRIIPGVAIYKFEEMEDSWKHICGVLKIDEELPHINKSKHIHYSEYYTEESKRIVGSYCYGEIKMMGYKFEKGEL